VRSRGALLRWFFRFVLSLSVIGFAVFLWAGSKAERGFDAKQGIGNLEAFKFWQPIANDGLLSAAGLWFLGLLIAPFAGLASKEKGITREARIALGVPVLLVVGWLVVVTLGLILW
jgi:hypothetical protein